MPTPARIFLLAPLLGFALIVGVSLPSCGGKVVVDGDGALVDPVDDLDAALIPPPDDLDAAPDAAEDPPPDAGPEAPPQCLCPDAPGYAPCIKPLECCPVVGVCKNPASFNCTGSTKSCP